MCCCLPSLISHVTAHHFEEANAKQLASEDTTKEWWWIQNKPDRVFLHPRHILFLSSYELSPPWNAQVTLQHIGNADWRPECRAAMGCQVPKHSQIFQPSRGRPWKYFIPPAGGASDNWSKFNRVRTLWEAAMAGGGSGIMEEEGMCILFAPLSAHLCPHNSLYWLRAATWHTQSPGQVADSSWPGWTGI